MKEMKREGGGMVSWNYTPLYEKSTKQNQIKPMDKKMETTLLEKSVFKIPKLPIQQQKKQIWIQYSPKKGTLNKAVINYLPRCTYHLLYKKMVLTSEQCGKHPFAGWNKCTQSYLPKSNIFLFTRIFF